MTVAGRCGRHVAAAIGSLSILALATCGTGDEPRPASGTAIGGIPAARDIEAPELFQKTDEGLWDGRPSLGGIWVAHPETGEPERVIIRNEANGRSVTGALFRRERDNPGPAFQVSAEAAEALGMLAGQPVTLAVTALKRPAPPGAPAPEAEDAGAEVAPSLAPDGEPDP